MRGFPIVGLGCITSSNQTTPPTDSFMVIPKFVCDEYYHGDETAAINSFKNYYSEEATLGYIKSVTIEENNLSLTTGMQTSTSFSQGFCDPLYYYSNHEKVVKINNMRIDSFYTIRIGYVFFNTIESLNVGSSIDMLYVNVPNLLTLDGYFSLHLMDNIYAFSFNMPKLVTLEHNFLRWPKNSYNLYFNLPSLNNIENPTFYKWNDITTKIHATSDEQIEILHNQFIATLDETSLVNIEKGKVCSLDVFDLRYWSKYENETGLDVGLLEGSNLR